MKIRGTRIYSLLATMALCLQLFSAVRTSAEAAAADIQNARNSVVRIVQAVFFDGEFYGLYSGTGVCVGEKGQPVHEIVTNRHVVDYYNDELLNEFKQIYPFTYEKEYREHISVSIVVLADNKAIEAAYEDVVLSNIADLAIVHVDEIIQGRVPAVLGKTESLKITDPVYALGFPGLADITDLKNNIVLSTLEQAIVRNCPSAIADITVTTGNISKTNVVTEGIEYIQHTADILHGNSGGPLISEKGEVLGINTFMLADPGSSSKIMYSISVNEVKRLLDQNGIKFVESREGVPISFLPYITIVIIICTVIIIRVVKKKHIKPKPDIEDEPVIEPEPGKTEFEDVDRIPNDTESHIEINFSTDMKDPSSDHKEGENNQSGSEFQSVKHIGRIEDETEETTHQEKSETGINFHTNMRERK